MRRLGAYLYFLRLGFMELVAYRITVLMLALSVPIVLFARYYVLAALYQRPGQMVEGYSLQGILTYLICAWLLRSFFRSAVDRRIGRDVRSGDIIFDLMRPLDYAVMTFFRALGKSLNRMLFISVPLLVLFLSTDVLTLPREAAMWPVFLLAVGIGFLIAFQFQFLVGIFTFFTGYNIGLIWTFDLIVQVLSGLLLPLHFFPGVMQNWLMALPFRHIYYTPTQIFVGHIAPGEAVPYLINGGLWVIGMGLLNLVVYRAGRRRLTIAGG